MQTYGQIPHFAIAGVDVATSNVKLPATAANTANVTKQAANSFFIGFPPVV
jgi:hypothetical protein